MKTDNLKKKKTKIDNIQKKKIYAYPTRVFVFIWKTFRMHNVVIPWHNMLVS